MVYNLVLHMFSPIHAPTCNILEHVEHCAREPEQAVTGIPLYAVPLAWQAKLHVAKQYSSHEMVIDADKLQPFLRSIYGYTHSWTILHTEVMS